MALGSMAKEFSINTGDCNNQEPVSRRDFILGTLGALGGASYWFAKKIFGQPIVNEAMFMDGLHRFRAEFNTEEALIYHDAINTSAALVESANDNLNEGELITPSAVLDAYYALMGIDKVKDAITYDKVLQYLNKLVIEDRQTNSIQNMANNYNIFELTKAMSIIIGQQMTNPIVAPHIERLKLALQIPSYQGEFSREQFDKHLYDGEAGRVEQRKKLYDALADALERDIKPKCIPWSGREGERWAILFDISEHTDLVTSLGRSFIVFIFSHNFPERSTVIAYKNQRAIEKELRKVNGNTPQSCLGRAYQLLCLAIYLATQKDPCNNQLGMSH